MIDRFIGQVVVETVHFIAHQADLLAFAPLAVVLAASDTDGGIAPDGGVVAPTDSSIAPDGSVVAPTDSSIAPDGGIAPGGVGVGTGSASGCPLAGPRRTRGRLGMRYGLR